MLLLILTIKQKRLTKLDFVTDKFVLCNRSRATDKFVLCNKSTATNQINYSFIGPISIKTNILKTMHRNPYNYICFEKRIGGI